VGGGGPAREGGVGKSGSTSRSRATRLELLFGRRRAESGAQRRGRVAVLMARWWWYSDACERELSAALLYAHREGEVELGASRPGEGVPGQMRGGLGVAGLLWPGHRALPVVWHA
jgi:hypothetical protein